MKWQCYPHLEISKSIDRFLYEGNTGISWVNDQLDFL